MNVAQLNGSSTIPAAAAWAGLDVAKATFDAGIYFPLESHEAPRPLPEIPVASFERSAEGVDAFAKWSEERLREFAARRDLDEPPPLRIVMEATGRYSIELAAWLAQSSLGIRSCIIDPKGAHDFMKSLRLRNITDSTSARVLSRYGFERKPEPWEDLAPEYKELRELSRQRDYIVETLVAARNRAGENTTSKVSAKLQKQVIRNLEKSLKKIEEAIKKHIAQYSQLKIDVDLLMTIPGVALWTSVVVLAELGDLRRFRKSRRLGAFAGLSPQQHDSGTSVHEKPRMCKQGSARVRQGLYMSALSAIRRNDAGMGLFYQNLVDRHKPKMVAIGAVMRKQLILMRSLLINQIPYDKNYRSAGSNSSSLLNSEGAVDNSEKEVQKHENNSLN